MFLVVFDGVLFVVVVPQLLFMFSSRTYLEKGKGLDWKRNCLLMMSLIFVLQQNV